MKFLFSIPSRFPWPIEFEFLFWKNLNVIFQKLYVLIHKYNTYVP